jgi:ATP-dependent DNA ligase
MGQHPLLEEALVEIKLGKYGVASAAALKDPTLLANVRNYKRQVASRMKPLAREDIARKIPDSDYHVSRKIDGEFCVLVYADGQAITVNPGGTVRQGLPWQKEAASALQNAGLPSAMIAGEIYVATDSDRRPRVHDVVSVLRQPQSEDDLERIRFAVFDILAIDGLTRESPYVEKFQWLQSTFDKTTRIHPVETRRLKGHREIEQQFRQWVAEQGAEGVVVRSESAGNFKIKPKHNIDAVVIGFTESTDDREGLLHDLLLGIARQDGSVQVLCRVGGGFTDENRREFLSDLEDMVVDSEYAEVNSEHVAYRMVEPKWVIEISCLDLISQNTRGGPVNRMVLNWNSSERRYDVVRRLPLVSVISPQFVRIRDDKQFDPTDVRMDQISELVPIPMTDVSASEMRMANSTLLERDVYTKPLRGELLVRKFLLWKTNKEQDSDEFPAYVAAYIDFSPSRKTPLTRDVRISNSEVQIRRLFGNFRETNIKKGWELHSSLTSDRVLAAPPEPDKIAPGSPGSAATKKSTDTTNQATERTVPGVRAGRTAKAKKQSTASVPETASSDTKKTKVKKKSATKKKSAKAAKAAKQKTANNQNKAGTRDSSEKKKSSKK